MTAKLHVFVRSVQKELQDERLVEKRGAGSVTYCVLRSRRRPVNSQLSATLPHGIRNRIGRKTQVCTSSKENDET